MNRIRHYRQALGLSQKQLARRLNMSRQAVSDWELGKRFPDELSRARLREILPNAPDLMTRVDELPGRVYRRVARLDPWPRSPDHRKVWNRGRFRYRETLKRLPPCPLPDLFEASTGCGSLEEVLCWLTLVSLGAEPWFASPYRMGFCDHPILDSFNASAGARLMPCLHLQREGLELFLFPQVRLRPLDQIYVVDALVLVLRKNSRCWMALELDGKGHNPFRDAQQQEEMKPPILRVPHHKMNPAGLWPCIRDQILERLS